MRTRLQSYIYLVTLNGCKISDSQKTHVSVHSLLPDTVYTIRVERDGLCQCEKLHTCKGKRRIDVTAAPYFVKRDSATINTVALQRAINDCTADACVYFPSGVFMTGALDLHSDMEIHLDDGAVSDVCI